VGQLLKDKNSSVVKRNFIRQNDKNYSSYMNWFHRAITLTGTRSVDSWPPLYTVISDVFIQRPIFFVRPIAL